MPADRKHNPSAGKPFPALATVVGCFLAGCVGDDGQASRASISATDPAHQASAPNLDRKGAVQSSVIDDLQARQSVLPDGSAFAQVANAVLAAGSGVAEAELRVARLAAKAKSKNWLPSIGPDVSLNSLGSLAASFVLEQAIFDNGRRKAERAFSAADVEVAAVTLATDLNQRVYEGLKLYIEGQRATELAGISEAALIRMKDFGRIMSIRVEGGISDRSEYQIIQQKLSETKATLGEEQEAARTAWAELNIMSGGGLDGLSGLTPLPADRGAPETLIVLLAKGEAARTMAEIDMALSGLMPGFGANANVDGDGGMDAGISLDGEGLGFGRTDNLRALEEAKDVARRKIDQAEETSDRRIVALEHEIVSLTSRAEKEAAVLAEMEANLRLFTEQYKAGRKTLLELAGQFEAVVRMKRDHASLKYAVAVARLEIARERGVLVNGAQM